MLWEMRSRWRNSNRSKIASGSIWFSTTTTSFANKKSWSCSTNSSRLKSSPFRTNLHGQRVTARTAGPQISTSSRSWSRSGSWRPSSPSTWFWLPASMTPRFPRTSKSVSFEEVLDSHLWQLHRIERSSSAHPPISRKDDALLLERPDNVPYIPL